MKSFESRVSHNTDRLLRLFASADTRATFFVLGWVAERYPDLIRRIHTAGHELGHSHSYGHGLVYDATPEAFRSDLRLGPGRHRERQRRSCEGLSRPELLDRSPNRCGRSMCSSREGYVYDSSIYPVRHDRYGIPDWPLRCTRFLALRPGGILFLGAAGFNDSWRSAGTNLPIGGGGYFRLLPYGWTRHGIRRLNAANIQPAILLPPSVGDRPGPTAHQGWRAVALASLLQPESH